MRSFRVYRMGPTGKVIAGDWLHAATEAAAKVKAAEFCRPGTPKVELWEADRLVATLHCEDLEQRTNFAGGR